MFASAFLAAATLAATSAAPAAASGDIARFEKYCVATDSNADAAKTAARADGFAVPPAGILPPPPATLKDGETLWKVVDGGALLLTVGKNPRGSIATMPRVAADFCATATLPPNPAAVGELEAFIGFKPDRMANGDTNFIFEDGKNRRTDLRGARPRQVLGALNSGQMRSAGARSNERMTMLVYMRLKP